MTTELATQNADAAMLEKVVVEGDLGKLSPQERLGYYRNVCDSLGLNPLTKPFQYIRLSGKLTLYATKDATEQLARLHRISIGLSDFQITGDVCIVKATATASDRSSMATGVVSIAGLKGENLANAMMKTETKASRRAVLRLVGLGWMDETEIESVPAATVVEVNEDTGEIVDAAPTIPPAWQQFLEWLDGYGNTLDHVAEVIGEPATLQSVGAYMRQHGLNGEEFKRYLMEEWGQLQKDKPALDEPVTAGGAEPNPNLPRKAMDGE